jgi:hypothetical protein
VVDTIVVWDPILLLQHLAKGVHVGGRIGNDNNTIFKFDDPFLQVTDKLGVDVD